VENTLVPIALISGLTRPSETGPQLELVDNASVLVMFATRILFFAVFPLEVMVDHPPVQAAC
jgi:hypothetical protein